MDTGTTKEEAMVTGGHNVVAKGSRDNPVKASGIIKMRKTALK